jgi:hypothetical protein
MLFGLPSTSELGGTYIGEGAAAERASLRRFGPPRSNATSLWLWIISAKCRCAASLFPPKFHATLSSDSQGPVAFWAVVVASAFRRRVRACLHESSDV